MTVPDFIIIGTQRCGTSSLYKYLTRHPQVAPARRKEVHYFDLNYQRGIGWYQAQFQPKQDPKALCGEASPYYLFHPLAARRCAVALPEAKIIVLLRDPVDRAHSHFHHEIRRGCESLSFEEALDREAERIAGERAKLIDRPLSRSADHQSYSYQARGVYADQLAAWMARFSRHQILIVESESLYEDPATQYPRVLKFLGLPRVDLGAYHQWNWGVYDPMAPKTRSRLAGYFAPHNQRLSELLGMSFRWS